MVNIGLFVGVDMRFNEDSDAADLHHGKHIGEEDIDVSFDDVHQYIVSKYDVGLN
jgi:hypothetical protein